MKKSLSMMLAATALALAGPWCAHATDIGVRRKHAPIVVEEDESNGVRIGTLNCAIGGGIGYVLGSAKEVACVFHSAGGREPSDHYLGVIRKFGVDLGFTAGSRLVWAVFAPTAGYHHGSLGGIYQGVTAEATVGAGLGANVLIGGTTGSIHLQPISVTGQLGLNVAASSTSMTLTPAN